jgi:hypothetical protein
MVSEIKSVGAQPMQGMVRIAQVGTGQVRPLADSDTEGMRGAQVQTRHAAYAILASIKDEAADVASSVRQAAQALERAEHTVQVMREKVEQFFVKNFPPFPPGSEQRVDYLNSISALRRQLESMSVPPLEGNPEPFIYPRDWDLPGLEPATATDEDVRAFGRVLDDMAQRLDTGYSELQAIVDGLPAWLPQDLPLPLYSDGQALDTSQNVANRLSSIGASLLMGSEGLVQFVG